MNCRAKHTSFQPSDSEWRCPRCGADVGHFVIEESDESADENCELLHARDVVFCESCGYSDVASHAAKLMEKYATEKTLVPCPCCLGKGYVSREKADEMEAKK